MPANVVYRAPTHRISLFVLLAIIILVGIVALVLWNGWTA